MSTKKLGRRPPRHTLRTMRSAIALHRNLGALGAPPAASDDYVLALTKAISILPPESAPALATGNTREIFGMFLNDSLGDCVCADTAHQVMLHTACACSLIVPSNDEVLKLY